MEKIITSELLERYKIYLYEQEKSSATIQKYMCDLNKLKGFADGRELNKLLVIEYKEHGKTRIGISIILVRALNNPHVAGRSCSSS